MEPYIVQMQLGFERLLRFLRRMFYIFSQYRCKGKIGADEDNTPSFDSTSILHSKTVYRLPTIPSQQIGQVKQGAAGQRPLPSSSPQLQIWLAEILTHLTLLNTFLLVLSTWQVGSFSVRSSTYSALAPIL